MPVGTGKDGGLDSWESQLELDECILGNGRLVGCLTTAVFEAVDFFWSPECKTKIESSSGNKKSL